MNLPLITLAIQGFIDPRHRELLARLDFLASTFSSELDGLEIGFFLPAIEEVAGTLSKRESYDILAVFAHNSLHVALPRDQQVQAAHLEKVMALASRLRQGGVLQAISFHLDCVPYFQLIEELNPHNLSLQWENLDRDAISHNTLPELLVAAASFPAWKCVFDAAHALDMRAAGQPPLDDYLAALGSAISQLHFSFPDNLYHQEEMGSGFDTRHSLFCLATDEQRQLVSPLLAHKGVEVITIEGVIPPGERGLRLLRQEIQFIRSFFQETQ